MFALFRGDEMISLSFTTREECEREAFKRGLIRPMPTVTQWILSQGIVIKDLHPAIRK